MGSGTPLAEPARYNTGARPIPLGKAAREESGAVANETDGLWEKKPTRERKKASK